MSQIDASITQPLFALYRAGDFKALAERARSLLLAHPEALTLHTLLGAACLELEEYDAAIESYRAALAIRPDFAKVHNSLGIACLRSGRLEEALGSFGRAIENDPRFAEPRFNQGIVLENGRRPADAAERYRQAVELDPGYCKAWSALAKVRWELGEYGRVAEYYERALSIEGKFVPAHRGLMQFLEQSNRHDELREAVARAREALGAEHRLVQYHEGVIAEIGGDSERARAMLENCRFEPGDPLTLHDERMRLARLTGICDRLDDVEAAIEYAAGANRLSGQSSAGKGVDKRKFLEFIDNRGRYFTAPNIGEWRWHEGDPKLEGHVGQDAGADSARRPERSRQPVFIVGFPRSGTTLIDTVLRGHPAIEVAEECDAVPTMVNHLSGPSDERLATLGDLSGAAIERARTVYSDSLAHHVQATGATRCVIDRFALNIVYAGEIHRIFPNARFILMLRHPADCVLSCFLRTFVETSANASFHTLDEAACLYDRVFGLWKQFTELLDLNVIEVKYEDLVADIEQCSRPVLDFIGAPWHPGILDHQRTARGRPYIRTASYDQVIQPLYAGATGRWLRYREHMVPILPTLEPWIETFGYAPASTPDSPAPA